MYKIGADVYTTDGRCGKLIKVVVDHDSGTVSHLVVERGLLHKVDRVIPVTAVAETSPKRIQLALGTAELEASFDEYREEHFQRAEPGRQPMADYLVDDPAHVLRWGIHYTPPAEPFAAHPETLKRGIDPDQPVIGKGTPVFDRDGQAGEVGEIQLDETTGQITHLVVNTGPLAHNLLVPMALVTGITDEGITIDAHRDALERTA
jgi:sporulation protein YlmC with PRC-barrel domain